MVAKIETLKKNDDVVYPVTKAAAVYDEDDINVQERIDDAVYADNPVEVTPEPWVGTSEIVDGAITSSKLDSRLGKAMLLDSRAAASISSSSSSPTEIDIRTLFTEPGSSSREAYFDEIIFDFNTQMESTTAQGYLRIGSTSVQDAVHRCCVTISSNGSVTSQTGNFPNIIFSAMNFFREQITIKSSTNFGVTNVDSVDWNNFSFSSSFDGTVFGDVRKNFGSFLRTQHTNNKLYMWFDGNRPIAGTFNIYGVRYPR